MKAVRMILCDAVPGVGSIGLLSQRTRNVSLSPEIFRTCALGGNLGLLELFKAEKKSGPSDEAGDKTKYE
jgi:hypothetical protein